MMKKLSENKKLLRQLKRGGVVIVDADSVYTEGEITIGRGTVIKPHVFLKNAQIGADCVIGPMAEISDSRIGDRTEILFTAQVKRSVLGDGCKLHHHCYIGDAEVGGNVNIGAGVITCNYDGKKKSRTVIGDNVFVGSNVNLIAPIKIGRGCYVAAGSTLASGLNTGEDNLIICREKMIAIKSLKK